MERRFSTASVGVETRDGKPRIVGYAAVFYRDNEPGTQFELLPGLMERITPTAFNRALSEGEDVRGLFNHDPTTLLGRTTAGTMRLRVDGRGLRYEIDPPDTQWGRDVMVSIERGDITGSSFSFEPTKRGSAIVSGESSDVRELRDVKLFDVGPVTFPAYGSTSTGLRSDGNDLTDALAEYEQYQKIERRLKEIRSR